MKATRICCFIFGITPSLLPMVLNMHLTGHWLPWLLHPLPLLSVRPPLTHHRHHLQRLLLPLLLLLLLLLCQPYSLPPFIFNYSSMARTIQFNRVVRARIKPCPIPCLNPTSTRLIGSGLTWIREKSFLSTNPFQRASLQVQSWSHCSLPHHLSQPLQREPATPLANLWQTTLLGTKKRNRSM